MEGSTIYTLLKFANCEKPIIAEMARVALGLIAPYISGNPFDVCDWLEDPDLFLAWELKKVLEGDYDS